MLVYDHERTEQIVQRLREADRAARWAVAAFAVLLFAAFGALIGGGSGAVVGAMLGAMIGMYASAVVSAVLEWMCQLLIAQGSMVHRNDGHETSAPATVANK
jgi:hypothetical protein